MFMLGPVGFLAPILLLGLVALPLLWILLRAVPPAPIRRRFPGVALLLGLTDDTHQTDKTPWWLLLLRMLAIAALIIGFAGPVLNPAPERAGSGPLLILLDGTWADARDWPTRLNRVEAVLAEAERAGRTIALVSLTDLPAGDLAFQDASGWKARLASFSPKPWQPDPLALRKWAANLPGNFESYWLSDGLARPSRQPLLTALQAHGPVTVFESAHPIYGLRPPVFADGAIQMTALRPMAGIASEITIAARGPDPSGIERDLATQAVSFEPSATVAEAKLSLPAELRNRVTSFRIVGERSAGAVSLTDDGLKRREVALISGREDREGLELLSPTHYLREALAPVADLIDGTIEDVLLANPDAIILADVAGLPQTEKDALADWVDKGGLLVRFAGPHLAASDISRESEDTLMPVRLREGGRSVGGAMSWGEPKGLRPFAEGSPFFGLTIPAEVTVSSQVMAQPDPTLADRTIAALADGTPLVTRKPLGNGEVILFHVTANAEWTTLPLSGLFVQMLERLAISSRSSHSEVEDLAGTTWVAASVLDAYGSLQDAGQTSGVAGETLAKGVPEAAMPPGLYADGDRQLALNVLRSDSEVLPADWPKDVAVEGSVIAQETRLKGAFLSTAMLGLLLDILASLWLTGRLRGPKVIAHAAVLVVLAFLMAPLARAQEQDGALIPNDMLALEATNGVVLAHVITGDAKLDMVAQAGLRGLSLILAERTSVEPAEPMAVDLETDELAFFPFLYWPISPEQPIPSAEAYSRLNRYLRNGGMILFDTRDADVADFGSSTPSGQKLQDLARLLDVPALEPLPKDHVLTRTFYLLQDFPGRFAGRSIWVEAAPPDAELLEGMPFRNLNDGVTPVVIGGNDWASAWAISETGREMFPIGRGYAGERQRETAYRFGVNLIMHVLTGNYKSDQVHVPALLDRLGQ